MTHALCRYRRYRVLGAPGRTAHLFVISIPTSEVLPDRFPAGHADHASTAGWPSTEAALALCRELGATLHQLSSVAVAGDFAGEYTEDDFDVGQQLPSRRHRAAFDAEQLVRLSSDVRWRIYRTGAARRRLPHR